MSPLTNRSIFSTPEIVAHYTKYIQCRHTNIQTIAFIQSSIGQYRYTVYNIYCVMIIYTGAQGSIHISHNNTYNILPSWTRQGGQEDSMTSILYMVVSSGRGRVGRERRERVRRLWAGGVGGDDRYVFVVPEVETEEENKEIIEEGEKFEDILQTDIKLSDSHAVSKQVKTS